MKLRLLREHFHSQDNITWLPKKGFTDLASVAKETGFDLDKCKIYTCSICELLHIATIHGNRIK